ncbi:MAG TPA: M20/M25/M40 family metallo-hydrolase [Ferruginibacter sp.]|nr:M20/M25/M40 family metallo-hydrolase [Ferruginibacter sp.]
MKRIVLIQVLLFSSTFSFAQQIDKIINVAEVERIERTLSADDMKGRKPFTPSIDKAADFIAAEFTKAGLAYLPGLSSYKQTFSVVKAKPVSATGIINGKSFGADSIICVSTEASLDITERSGYSIQNLDTSSLMTQANRLMKQHKNYIVLVDSFHAANFSKLKRFRRESFKNDYSVLFIRTDLKPASFHFRIEQEISSSSLTNVVGYLPGRSKKDDQVVFSGHYDHLGVVKPNAEQDSIYNGANDDAAGTTAVIMLAHYFAKQKNNERSLVFVAFTAEEIGGYGSRYFSQQINADKTVAMFNIEMIGTESKWGTNSAYITGYEKSDLGKILQSNLSGTAFHFEPDPYPKQQLFYRSDNATLAALGVPAHTISTSKMDSEKYYHTLDDEIETLDMNNMAEIIKAIAISSTSIVNGKDTPSRVEKKD